MIQTLLRHLEASKHRKHVKAAAEACFGMAGSILCLMPGSNRCPICSARLVCLSRPVVGDDLVGEWGIDQGWRDHCDERDGQICVSCGGSLRVRHLAATMVLWLKARGGRALTATAAVRAGELTGVRIAEINSCGALHKVLARLPSLAYSEYLPELSATRHEDLLGLSYADESFDLVLHSDTLEHTPDVDRALSEIYRVLKPGGASIFTVPLVLDGRATRVRAEIVGGAPSHLLPPSYHGGSYQSTAQYLVYYEFGGDFVARVTQAGFDVALQQHPPNPAVVTFVATKPRSCRVT